MPKPEIRDVIAELPTAHPELRRYRALGVLSKIAVHYDAQQVRMPYDPLHRYKAQARYHIEKDWGGGVHGFGLMYPYRVDAMGGIWQTQPEQLVTWSVRDANVFTLSICCDLGDGQNPTGTQLASLTALLDWLCYERPEIPAGRVDVFGHGELTEYGNDTKCPGNLLDFVKAYRAGRVVSPSAGRYFSETQQSISGVFLRYWESKGGLEVFGLPLTKREPELCEDGQTRPVQWFERACFELHDGDNVVLRRVGAALLKALGRVA